MSTINKINVGGIDYGIESAVQVWEKQAEFEEGNDTMILCVDNINLFKPITIEMYKNTYDSEPIEILSLVPNLFLENDKYILDLFVCFVLPCKETGEFFYRRLLDVASDEGYIEALSIINGIYNDNGFLSISMRLSKYGTSADTFLYKVYGYENNKACPPFYTEY